MTEATTFGGTRTNQATSGADDQRAAAEQPPQPASSQSARAPLLPARCPASVRPVLAQSGVAQQVAAEVRHGEGDLPALGGVDQALLDQRVARRGQRRRLAAQGDGDLRRGDGGAARAAQLGHRVHVLALGGGGAVVAGAEEADGELGLGDRRGHRDVGGGDGGGGGDVPGDLAVGLDEVGVAVGRRVQGVERGRLELDVLPLGRGQQRAVGGLPVEPVDPQVAEQPLGVALGGAQHGRQVGEARADDDQRRALLGELVAGGADGRDVVGLHVLHLVDEQRDAAADVGGHARRRR